MTKANLFQDVQKFMDKLQAAGGKPLYELTPDEAREVLLNVQDVKTEMPEVERQEIETEVGHGRYMRLEITKPKVAEKLLPVIYYIHGGGWVMGDNVTHRRLVSELAVGVQAAVVFPIYEQAPEGQFPLVTEDLFKALQYISQNGDKYGLDASHLAVAGDSVGGNMAAVMAMAAKENGFTPTIDFLLLLYPVTSAAMDTPSYEAFADGPWLTKKAMAWFWDQYLPDKDKRRSKEASPLAATVADLQDLPPVLIITAENDVLRDEGEAFARKLDQAGVKTFAIRCNGTIHDFMVLNELSQTAPTRAAITLAKSKLKWYLYPQK